MSNSQIREGNNQAISRMLDIEVRKIGAADVFADRLTRESLNRQIERREAVAKRAGTGKPGRRARRRQRRLSGDRGDR